MNVLNSWPWAVFVLWKWSNPNPNCCTHIAQNWERQLIPVMFLMLIIFCFPKILFTIQQNYRLFILFNTNPIHTYLHKIGSLLPLPTFNLITAHVITYNNCINYNLYSSSIKHIMMLITVSCRYCVAIFWTPNI